MSDDHRTSEARACSNSVSGKHEPRLTSSGRFYCDHCDEDLPDHRTNEACPKCGEQDPTPGGMCGVGGRHGHRTNEAVTLEAIDVACPVCGGLPGKVCRTADDHPTAHERREKWARELSRPDPCTGQPTPGKCRACETREAVLCESCYRDDHSILIDDERAAAVVKCNAKIVGLVPRLETARNTDAEEQAEIARLRVMLNEVIAHTSVPRQCSCGTAYDCIEKIASKAFVVQTSGTASVTGSTADHG